MKFSWCLTNYHTTETFGTVKVQLHTVLNFEMGVTDKLHTWLICLWGKNPPVPNGWTMGLYRLYGETFVLLLGS